MVSAENRTMPAGMKHVFVLVMRRYQQRPGAIWGETKRADRRSRPARSFWRSVGAGTYTSRPRLAISAFTVGKASMLVCGRKRADMYSSMKLRETESST